MTLKIISGDSGSSSGGGTAQKHRYNINWSGRGYTYYDYWYYLNDSFGASYQYMNTSHYSPTLGETAAGLGKWPATKHIGLCSPITGKIIKFQVSYHSTTYTSIFEFALLKGTFEHGVDDTISMVQVGETITVDSEAQKHYNVSHTLAEDMSINEGDQLMIAIRRTNNANAVYHYLNLVFNIVLEEE